MTSKKQKQQESMSQYGTMTAKFDANNDYSGKSTSSPTSSSTTSSTTGTTSTTDSTSSSMRQKQQQSMNEYGTMTAKFDVNGDYSSSESESATSGTSTKSAPVN